ncbi:MAG: hypothetical protein H6728_11885 [Myxococcales bacterium]|nr:hypothetical protein [Myxococcales bacterium]
MSSIRRSDNRNNTQRTQESNQAKQAQRSTQQQPAPSTRPSNSTPASRDSFTTKNESKGNLLTGRNVTTERSHDLNGTKYTSKNSQTTSLAGKSTTMSKGLERANGEGQSREITTKYGMRGNKTSQSSTSTKTTADLTETKKLDTSYGRNGSVTSQSASTKLEENYKLDDIKLSTSLESKTSTSEAKGGGIFGENKRTTSSETTKSSIEDKNVSHSTSETVSNEKAFDKKGNVTMSKDTISMSETDKKDGKSTTLEMTGETTNTKFRGKDLSFQSNTEKTSTEHGNGWTTDKTVKTESGSKFTTTKQDGASNTKFENGKLTTKAGVEYKNTHSSKSTTWGAEREAYKGVGEDAHKQRQTTNKNISNAQSIAKEVFGSKELSPKIDTDTHKREETISAAGYERKETFSASASVWEKSGKLQSGDLKKDGYEAKISGDVKVLNASGEATTNVKLGGLNNEVSGKLSGQLAVLDANVAGNYTQKLGSVAGVDITAGVEGKGRAFVGADGSLEGKVTASIYPPEAAVTVKGEAFAGAKLEGEVKGHAGPFSVTASGSLNAGAGVEGGLDVGLSDGKLRFQANLGATLGIGASGNVAVEVDVAQIAKVGVEGAKVVGREVHKAAVNTFDATGDGKLGLDDARAIGSAAVDKVSSGLSSARDTVASGLSSARDTIGSGLSSAADTAKEIFSGW